MRVVTILILVAVAAAVWAGRDLVMRVLSRTERRGR